MKAIVKAMSKGSIVMEYVNSYKTDLGSNINLKATERRVKGCQKWLKEVETKIKQANPTFQMRWSEVSPEIMLHYIWVLEKRACRHKERMMEVYETIETLIDFWEFLNYEYGHGKLLNAARLAYIQYKAEKRKTA